MINKQFLVSVFFVIAMLAAFSLSAEGSFWPKDEKLAISLSYDDALDSQLDNVIPLLNKYHFKASFYVVPASEYFGDRIEDWRAIAQYGHELGNHSLYHGCSKRLAGDWVADHVDLDKRTVEDLVSEIRLANVFLEAIDGKTERTFTIPCGHMETKNGNYVQRVADDFVAIKGQEIQSGFSTLLVPNGQSGKDLIRFIQQTPAEAKLVNILFHGVGDTDHDLRVSNEAHSELLTYLSKNKELYWVDSYINIMRYVTEQRR